MNEVYKNIQEYYTDKVRTYGATPKGVDWNGEESQILRFKQLSKIINCDKFSLADLGCGYGKYCDYLDTLSKNYLYIGYDFSNEMIQNAKQIYRDKKSVKFTKIDNLNSIEVFDYIISSGIFSVKMKHSESQWLSYILDTLETMNTNSKKGFSFNLLTKYSDIEYMRDNLYYADPLFFFDYCKRNFSDNISLLHDYGLYEFTILVRKDI